MYIDIIANKCDLVKEKPDERKVELEEIQQFAEENNLIFIGESSALSDMNIKEVVENLMQSKFLTIIVKIGRAHV